MAIWLLKLFLKCAAVERLQTERADEVVRMVFLAHCRHTPASDWLTTGGTWHAVMCKEMSLTIHCTVQLIEP